MKVLKNLTKCRVCFSKKLKEVMNFKPMPIGEDFNYVPKKNQKKYNLDVLLCRDCGLTQIKQIIDPKVLYKKYLYQTKTSVELKDHFKDYAKNAIKLFKRKKNNLSVVDIGSNDGSLLHSFQKKNCNVIGIEPAKHIAKIANQNNIFTINSYFNNDAVNKVKKLIKKPDLICANNVVANIDDIHTLLKNVKKLLSNESFFIFETFYLLDVIKNKVFDFIYHEHLTIFSLRPVKKLCNIHNLQIVDVKKVKTKGGSIRFYIKKKSNKNKINNSLNLIKNNEKEFKIYKEETFLNLSKRINKNRWKLAKLMSKMNLKDVKFVGVGASISCITLMYQLNIEKRINFLIDDNKLKEGMFSPGNNLKIYNPRKIDYKKKYVFFILAWRFKKFFYKKYKQKFKNNLIEVWPEVKTNYKKFI